MPLLLAIDEYNAFLGAGKLLEYDGEKQQYIPREHVDAKENAVARIFEWNTFRLVGTQKTRDSTLALCKLIAVAEPAMVCAHQGYGTVLFALSSSTFAHLTAKDGNQSAVTLLNPLQRKEVMAFQLSLNSGHQ